MVRLADSRAARYDDLLLKMDEVRMIPLTITSYTERDGTHGPYIHIAATQEHDQEPITISTGAAAVMDQLARHFSETLEPLEHVVFEERMSKKGTKYWLLADADEAEREALSQAELAPAPDPGINHAARTLGSTVPHRQPSGV